MEKIEITEIKIKLKDREIVLSSDDAREVFTALSELFAQENKDLSVQSGNRFLEELKKMNDKLDKVKPATVPVPYPIYPNPLVILELV